MAALSLLVSFASFCLTLFSCFQVASLPASSSPRPVSCSSFSTTTGVLLVGLPPVFRLPPLFRALLAGPLLFSLVYPPVFSLLIFLVVNLLVDFVVHVVPSVRGCSVVHDIFVASACFCSLF